MCDFAELWLRPRPGTDVALLNAMAKVILDEGLLDEAFVRDRTEGFQEWRQVVEKYDLGYAEQLTGVPSDDIAEAARIYARPPFSGSCLIWGMGITQHTNGTANAHGLLNLALGRRVRWAGRAPGHLSAARPEQRAGLRAMPAVCPTPSRATRPSTTTPSPSSAPPGAVTRCRGRRAWSSPIWSRRCSRAGLGRCTSPARTRSSASPISTVRRRRSRAWSSWSVQDIFLHETAEIADVVLPATSFAEKRRYVHQQRAPRPAGPQGGGARRRKPPGLGDPLRAGAEAQRSSGPGRGGGVRLQPPFGDMGRDGQADSQLVGDILRAPRGRWGSSGPARPPTIRAPASYTRMISPGAPGPGS